MAASCSVCCEDWSNDDRCPRLLPCGHTFCLACLVGLAKTGTITCPNDRQIVRVAADQLPKNFLALDLLNERLAQQPAIAAPPRMCELCDEPHPASHYCHDCSVGLCSMVARIHAKVKAISSHRIVEMEEAKGVPALKAGPVVCEVHHEPAKLLCLDDNTLVCVLCVATTHAGHKFETLTVAAANAKRELGQLAGQARARGAAMKQGAKAVVDALLHLNRKCDDERAKITTVFEEVCWERGEWWWVEVSEKLSS